MQNIIKVIRHINLLKIKPSMLSFILMSVLPSFFYVAFNLTSLTLGYLFATGVSLSLFVMLHGSKLGFTNLKLLISGVILIVLTGFITPYGLSWRALGACVMLMLMLLLAALMSNYIKSLSDHEFKKVFIKFSRLLIFFGLLGFFIKLELLNYDKFAKSIFLFYEPSHYATALGAIIISYLLIAEKFERNLVVSVVIFLSLFAPSLTLLVYLLVFLIISLRNIFYYFIAIFTLVITAAIVYTINPELTSYFLSRLVLSSENNNLSALVYIQGWAEAYKVFQDGYFFGLGFHMSGSNSPSMIAEKIFEIAGEYKNRDGSFIASKLVVDFGLLGVLTIILYLLTLIKLFFSFDKIKLNKFKFVYGTLFAFSIEMFVRSNAYFTFGVFILFTSIFLTIDLYYSKANLHK